jgi:hypothetical protein
MKFLIPAILLMLFLFACAAKKTVEFAEGSDTKSVLPVDYNYLWVFKPNINVRESNSGASAKIEELADGDSVKVLTNVGGWYQIQTDDKQKGWIRSDLLGPRNLSVFRPAVAFADSLKNTEKIELFFDKKLYYKRIYLSLPPEFYSSRANVENKMQAIVKNYQEKVYSGKLTVRVFKPGSEEEYLTKSIGGTANADPLLPVMPFGRIKAVERPKSTQITLDYQVPPEIQDQELLVTARQLSSIYPISFQQVEIIFRETDNNCRLWFIEDANGEDYKFNKCK